MTEKLTTPLEEFKPREIEIITLMAEGYSNKEIAELLFIGTATVRWYNKQIYSKLGTSRRTEAIALAREMGIIGGGELTADAKVMHNLPVTTGPFIGRDEETAELVTLLDKPGIRLVSIVATGGMGKSRLALEFGHLVKDDYKHGAAFIDLSAVYNPEDIAKFAAESLGLSVSGRQDPIDVLSNYCREKELLLIFDNFEQVVVGASLLSTILEVAPNVKIIATSRERLKLRAETVYNLEPVSVSGGKLFMELARMMRPSITIDESEQEAVERIVKLVGGLPLGLVLAATWVDMLTIPEIAEEIENNLDFLSAEMGDMPERQQSIHAVIDPTWNRLNEQEQKAFMWASVFRGGFTRKHFQEITGASLATIQTLLSRSLIAPGYGRRYAMHPLLRKYAREKLIESGNLGQARKAHLETFLAYAKHHAERMYNNHYLDALEAWDSEQDNFRGALDWALTGQAVDDGVSLVKSLVLFWAARSQARESIHYLEKALSYGEEAALLFNLGTFLSGVGDMEGSKEKLRKAIALAEETADINTLADAKARLLFRLIYSEETDILIPQAQQALSLAQQTKQPKIIANAHNLLGVLYSYKQFDPSVALDYYQKGLAHYQQAQDIYEQNGTIYGIASTTYNMALLYHERLGNSAKARELCEYSLELSRKIGDRDGNSYRLFSLAAWDILEEEFERAAEYLAESRAILEELGDQLQLSNSLRVEGFMYLVSNRYDQARMTLERGLAVSLAAGNHFTTGIFYSYLGLLYLINGNISLAKQNIEQAVETEIKSPFSSWTSIVAYANYLWYTAEYDTCLPIAAVLFLNQDDYAAQFIETSFFVTPLVYRLKNKVGEVAWETALAEAEGVTVEAAFEEIAAEVSK